MALKQCSVVCTIHSFDIKYRTQQDLGRRVPSIQMEVIQSGIINKKKSISEKKEFVCHLQPRSLQFSYFSCIFSISFLCRTPIFPIKCAMSDKNMQFSVSFSSSHDLSFSFETTISFLNKAMNIHIAPMVLCAYFISIDLFML